MKKITMISVMVLSVTVLSAQTWFQVATPTNAKLNAIDFPSGSVGYIAGDEGILLKTTDGGVTWGSLVYFGISSPSGTPNFADVDFVDELTGFITVKNANPGSYKTTDGGLNWESVENSASNQCYKYSVYAFDADNWFLGGAGCFQGAMINHYDNAVWSESSVNGQSFNASEEVLQMDFLGSFGLAAIRGRQILRTTDGGATWDTIPSGLSATGILTSVLIVDNNLCYAGYDENGNGYGLMKSTDGGLTWEQHVNMATFYYPAYLSLGKANNGNLYSGARPSGFPGGLIFETADSVNWTFEEVDQPINAIASYGEDITFAVGDSGYVVVNTQLSQLGLEKNQYSEDAKLIYPNPASDFFTLQHAVNDPIVFELVDINGQRLSVGMETFPSYTRFNISKLPRGIYLLRSNTSDFNRSYRIIKE